MRLISFSGIGSPHAPLLASLLWMPLQSPPAAQDHIAYVMQIHGTWVVKGTTKPLAPGHSVPPGVEIVRRTSGDPRQDRITLVYRNNTTSPRCEHPCDSLTVLSSLTTTSWGRRVRDAVVTLIESAFTGLSSDPDRVASLHVRGRGLQDGVVKLTDTRVDFGPTLRHTEAGRYVLRLSPLTPSAPPIPLDSVPFQWRRTSSAPVAIVGVTPGLYECRLFVLRYGQLDDTGQRAWVLIADAAAYDEVSASFIAITEMTTTWSEVDEEAVQSFLRATLDTLASSVIR